MGWTIENVQEADVEPAAVFALYADPGTWHRWGHNATWARSDGPVREGGAVDVRANYGTVYHCLVRRLVPDRALELVVRPAGLTIINVYEVEPTARGSRIRHAFEVSGPIATPARLFLARIYRRQLEDEVTAVARMAKDPDDPRLRRGDPSPVSPPERAWHRAGKAVRGGREEQ